MPSQTLVNLELRSEKKGQKFKLTKSGQHRSQHEELVEIFLMTFVLRELDFVCLSYE